MSPKILDDWDSESVDGGVSLLPQPVHKDIRIKDYPPPTPDHPDIIRIRHKIQNARNLSKFSKAFSAFDPANGVDLASPHGYTLEPVKKLRPRLPDEALYPEEKINQSNPVKGWTHMSLLDRFLWRYEEFFDGDGHIENTTMDKILGLGVAEIEELLLTMTGFEFEAEDRLRPKPRNTYAQEPCTVSSLAEEYFDPIAKDAHRLLEDLAFDIDSLLSRLQLLHSYVPYLQVPSSDLLSLPFASQEQLKKYTTRIKHELERRTRNYSLLILYVVLIELRRDAWLSIEYTTWGNFVKMMKDTQNIRHYMADMRVWIGKGNRFRDWKTWFAESVEWVKDGVRRGLCGPSSPLETSD